ncbi:MAG TPA: response regulator transcription factor [Burkholderiaceae bacterium]|nr:response regulator transcription factor [Burkholderiaceae bacterium]
MKSQVLIAESHRLLRQQLCSLVSALPDFEVIGDCSDGQEVLRLASELTPDLLLMELFLPGLSVMDAAAQIKPCLPKIRIAVLTSEKMSEYVRAALRAGVDGYILKDASYTELVCALRSITDGRKFLSPEVSRQMIENAVDDTNHKAAPVERLTARERSIWKHIAEGRTNRATASLLNVSPKTIEKHRANLMRKLGLRNVAELMLLARGYGIVANPASPLQPTAATTDQAPGQGTPTAAPIYGK